ncbi:hypothetical protein F5B21DRAFT_500557 [Xylaria acuta]|nr:hypothetical protein F5B21DRAFT_500557 [Xylaria acuta]
MVVQVSIGDGILLAQIAWRLAQTFTKGRQSAPAEFQEIENELYALSAALTAAENELNNARPPTTQAVPENNRHTATQDVFGHIIQNCKNILAHLEEIVNKYTIVSEKADLQKPKLKRWSQSIVKNWRKIEWTTEKGDLNTLRSQIMVHTNSLNLLVNIGTSSRTASIERLLDTKLTLLEELHQWYVINLKEAVPKRSTTPDGPIHAPGQTAQIQLSSLTSTFELAKKREAGDEIICPCVSLRSEWIESFIDGALDASSGSMFACSCLDYHVGVLSHQVAVQRYELSHLVFPIRIASNDRSWMLYKTADSANNQLVDLYIRKIHPSYIRRLEDTFFRTLSSRRGEAILAQGAGNSLCYISPEDQEQHILEVMSDLSISQKDPGSARSNNEYGAKKAAGECDDRTTFCYLFYNWRREALLAPVQVTNGFSPRGFTGVSTGGPGWTSVVFGTDRAGREEILQYGMRESDVSVDGTQTDPIRWLEYAEVLVSFNADEAQESGDVISMVLKLRRNTLMKLTEKASVDITSIEAVGTHSDQRTTSHNGLNVTIQFTTKSAAQEFHKKIEAMRTELFVRSLQYPRSNEKVVLNLQTARVECESLYIDDAEIFIVVDTDAKYRLIIASRNRCTIISQTLVEDFFASPSNRPNYTGSTYLVQIGDTGERKIYHYKNGFRHLSLSTAQGWANTSTKITTNS